MPVLFCFGLGYTARALARRLHGEGWEVRGTSRDAAKIEALEAQGWRVFPFERGRPLPDPAAALGGVTHLLSSIAPDAQGDPVLAGHAADLRALRSLEWSGYLGTTGVYGDRGGAWVDEQDEPAPRPGRTAWRVGAEQAWLGAGLKAHVFRLAGIYGPGRNPLAQLRHGTARRIVKPGQVFSRIHVEDIVTVLRASMARPCPGRIYNVCDDEPAPSHEVMAFAAGLLGVEPPPELDFASADLSPMARSFYADNRRVRNARIKEELGVRLAYPGYRDGLRALLAEERRKESSSPAVAGGSPGSGA